jgi:ADP-ribose pyrophosphatase YjhB (NUDIX family)
MKTLLAFLLKYINPHKPLGTALFNAVARVSVSVAFEAVAFRRAVNGEREIYLTKRADNDAAYGGQWHVPGSILRPQEKDEHILARLGRQEFGTKIIKAKFVAMLSNPGEARGHVLSLVYLVKLEAAPSSGGQWFLLNKLPPNTITFHKKYLIPLAAKDHKFEDITEAKIKTLEI